MVKDAAPPLLALKLLPFVTVKPDIVTSDPKFSNTREVALPSTARFPKPGPLMVTLWVI